MDNRLSFDVYAKFTDPSCRVELDALDSWVQVVVGGSAIIGPPTNMLQLWFKEPETVVALGKELISAGAALAEQRARELLSCDDLAESPHVEGDTAVRVRGV